MKCSRCGAHVPENNNFCPSCGNPMNNNQPYQPIGGGIVPPTGAPQSPYGQGAPGYPAGYPQPPYPPKKNNNVILITVIAVASVVICALLLLLFLGKNEKPAREEEDDDIRIERTSSGRDTVYVAPAQTPAPATAPAKKAKTGSLRNIGFTDDYSDYVCYTRLSDSDVAGLSSSELRILRNTIYARHGRKFKSADLRNYFSRFSWYTPLYDEVSESSLTATERHNIMLIKKYE